MLRAAGIDVVITDLDRLRDSNFLYSSLWRLALGLVERRRQRRGLAAAIRSMSSRSDVTFGAWARLANFKANHRKVIIGDDGGGELVGIVTSAQPARRAAARIRMSR